MIIDAACVGLPSFTRQHKILEVITGFNTDVEYNGVTYHVQTEDKGVDTPLILSLVYNRGTILASKRSPYNDLLLGNFNEKELSERLNRQHKLICAAIRAGRIEDLKKMTGKKADVKLNPVVSENKIEAKPLAEIKVETKLTQPKVETTSTIEIEPTPIPRVLQETTQFYQPIKKPSIELPQIEKPLEINDAPIEITDADLIFEDTETINDTKSLTDVIILTEDAVEIVTDFFADEKIDENKILVDLMHDVVFKSGDNKTVSILVSRGSSEKTLPGANIMVKVIGSNFRPLIYHTKTDSNGVAVINLQLPQFSRGRAAVLFKAMVNGDESEIRRVIQPI